jgi:restriction system protein
MSIPTYKDIMHPFLQTLADVKMHTLKELHVSLADHFAVSDEKRQRLLPSGSQMTFYNRLGWTRTHLKKALLISSLGSGKFQITERGKELLVENPSKITNKLLMKYPEVFTFWRSGLTNGASATTLFEAIPFNSSKTLRELIHECYREIRNALSDDHLQQISSKLPAFFEHLVLEKWEAGGKHHEV